MLDINRLLPTLTLMLLATATATSVLGAEKRREPVIANGIEPVVVNQVAFPSPIPEERVQIWTGSYFAPSTDFGGTDLGLARAELRARARIPRDDVVVLEVLADFRTSLYDSDGGGPLFADCAACPTPDEVYSATLAAQGGYLINRDRTLFRSEERWAVLGALYGRARWESGAFEESITPGLALGIGYQLPGKLRIAAGARVERALDGNGVRVSPWGDLSWDFAPKFRLRNRALGLLLEYRPASRLEVFATAFQTSDRFRLDDRPGFSAGPTFRDRQLLVGGGLMIKIAQSFRIWGEAGAIVDRRIAVGTRDDSTIDSMDGDLSPYFAIRAELRP